jgi:hypothetical protein
MSETHLAVVRPVRSRHPDTGPGSTPCIRASAQSLLLLARLTSGDVSDIKDEETSVELLFGEQSEGVPVLLPSVRADLEDHSTVVDRDPALPR